jgi:hypothetical protein
MDLSLKEKLGIILLDPDKGRILMDQNRLTYALTACLIFEMKESGLIEFDKDKLRVKSFKYPKDPLHEVLFRKMNTGKKDKKFSTWIMKFSRKGGYYKKHVIQSLQNKQIIGKERKRFMNLIPYNRYFFINLTLRRKLLEKLRTIVFDSVNPEQEDILILGLVSIGNVNKIIYRNKEERKLLKKRMEVLLSEAYAENEIRLMLKKVQETVRASNAAVAGT